MGGFQKIEKPIRARAWDTSGNNNHGQIYSGRALEFDGVSDYLQVNGGTNLTLIDWSAQSSAEDRAWTIAFWIQPRKDESGFTRITGNAGSMSSYIAVTSNQNLAVHSIADGEWAISDYAMTLNIWHRVVITYDGSTGLSFYFNGTSGTYKILGVAATSITIPSGVEGDLQLDRIGDDDGDDNFDGYLSDFQAWQGEWSSSDALFDYQNPEQLALNNSGTSLTESNLKLWYPMNDGHRGQQSFVTDASNTGLGEELLTNGDFSDASVESTWDGSSKVNLSGWTSAGTHNGTHYWEITDGQCRLVTTNGTSTSMSQSILTSGVIYRYSFTINTSADGRIKLQHGSTQIVITDAGATGTFTGYFTASHTDFKVVRGDDGSTGDGANDVTFDNVSVKAVNNKNHGTTAFYGEELIGEENNREFESATDVDWAVLDPEGGSGVAISVDSGTANKLQVTTTTDNEIEGAELAIVHVGDGTTTKIVKGRTYQIKMDLEVDAGTPLMTIALGGTAVTAFNISTTETTYTKEVVATNNTGSLQIRNVSATALVFTVDNVSVKEIGTASGWTDADQQLTIPQTALQSYNQLMWFDGAADYAQIADHSDFTFGSGSADEPFSVSAWVFFNNATVGYQPIISKYAAGDRREWALKLGAASATDGKLNFLTYDESNDAYIGRKYDTALSSGKWYHIVGTKDDTEVNSGFALYINGEKLDDEDHDGGSYTGTGNGPSTVDIGFSHNGNYMNGCITECSIWDKELSQAEVAELYNGGLALDATVHSENSEQISNISLYGSEQHTGVANFSNTSTDSVDFDGTSGESVEYYLTITDGIVSGQRYKVELTLSNYSGSGNIGVSNYAGVTINARLTANGTYSEYFTSDGNEIKIFGRDTNSGTLNVKVTKANLLGYWRNNGLATWQDLTANDRDATPQSGAETMLITTGADASRDSQGFIMNRQRATSSLNLYTHLHNNEGTLSSNIEAAYVKIPKAPLMTNSTAVTNFSICAWVKIDRLHGGSQVIYDDSQDADDNVNKGLQFYINTNGILHCVVWWGIRNDTSEETDPDEVDKVYSQYDLDDLDQATITNPHSFDSNGMWNGTQSSMAEGKGIDYDSDLMNSGNFPTDQWFHVAVTFDHDNVEGATNETANPASNITAEAPFYTYVNGILVAKNGLDGSDDEAVATDFNKTMYATPDHAAVIGSDMQSNLPRPGNNTHDFDGEIDDLLIYSDTLTSREVLRIYNAGKRSHR